MEDDTKLKMFSEMWLPLITSNAQVTQPMLQCWTVNAIFTFGRSQMFGPEKLRPLAVDRSRSRRLKKCKTYAIKVLISSHSN